MEGRLEDAGHGRVFLDGSGRAGWNRREGIGPKEGGERGDSLRGHWTAVRGRKCSGVESTKSAAGGAPAWIASPFL